MTLLSRKSLSLAVMAGLAVSAVWSSAEAARRGGGRGRSGGSFRRSGGSSFRGRSSSSFRRSGGSSIRRSTRTPVRRTTRTPVTRSKSSIGNRIRNITNNRRGNNTRRNVGNTIRRNIGRKIGSNAVRRATGRRIVISSRIRSARRVWRRGLFGHRLGRRWGIGIVGRRFYFGFRFFRPIRRYYNPYCCYGGFLPNVCDYSQPIVDDGQVDQGGLDQVNDSGDAFLQGDYQTALAQADKAVKEMPNNPDVHQYRSLVLFALGRYQESAAAAHAALIGGKGWNWDTLKSFYSDSSVYTQQLRALEKFTNDNPQAAYGLFLLGYQYMMLEHADAAGKELAAALALEPNDTLTAELLKSISAKTGKTYKGNAAPAGGQNAQPNGPAGNGSTPLPPLPPNGTTGPQGPVAPSQPAEKVEATALVGTWKAVREKDLTITLQLKSDGTFTWNIDTKGQKIDIKGTYKLAGNELTMSRDKGPALVGTVKVSNKDEFQFTAKSAPSNDPGFVFKRQ